MCVYVYKNQQLLPNLAVQDWVPPPPDQEITLFAEPGVSSPWSQKPAIEDSYLELFHSILCLQVIIILQVFLYASIQWRI